MPSSLCGCVGLASFSAVPMVFRSSSGFDGILESLQPGIAFRIFLRQILLPPVIENHEAKRRGNANSELPLVLAQETLVFGRDVARRFRRNVSRRSWCSGMFYCHSGPKKVAKRNSHFRPDQQSGFPSAPFDWSAARWFQIFIDLHHSVLALPVHMCNATLSSRPSLLATGNSLPDHTRTLRSTA
jgi:hypothetical protein